MVFLSIVLTCGLLHMAPSSAFVLVPGPRPVRRTLVTPLQAGSDEHKPVPILSAEEVASSLWKTADIGGALYDTNVHGVIRCNGNDSSSSNDNDDQYRYRLLYLPCRNRGEILRLILEESRVPYEVEVVGFQNWIGGIKDTTPHGKCPVLRIREPSTDASNTVDLGQEGAITRYLAEEFRLAGTTPLERAKVDSLYCFWFSTMRNNGVSHDGDFFSIAALKEATLCDGDGNGIADLRRPRYEDVQRLETLNEYSRAEVSLIALDYFERRLEENNSSNVNVNGNGNNNGWLVGNACTYVDLGLFYILFELSELDNVGPNFDKVLGLPRLGRFLQMVSEQPHISDYLYSPRRMPRYSRAASGQSLYTYLEGRGSPRIVL
eukprot:CAMPEP_0194397006 /NCGR_PEP_ID=MMETSP0174-20130528/125305_1 /TAXON_ID=216777 /ORGANISM="Proboscia alata, Strain PI-D3" /LENGTH=376 /DNA_ID=CAMNT_0039193137 /DNA_START=98 /DNA_END=1228 /DNA_ORIENTATION=+